jgi:hypothetical protein
MRLILFQEKEELMQTLPVGSMVVTKKEYLGTTINDITYGYLPVGAKGQVEEYTEDGRAVIHFPGYGYHTFNNTEGLVSVVQSPLERAFRQWYSDHVEAGGTDYDVVDNAWSEFHARFRIELIYHAVFEMAEKERHSDWVTDNAEPGEVGAATTDTSELGIFGK